VTLVLGVTGLLKGALIKPMHVLSAIVPAYSETQAYTQKIIVSSDDYGNVA